MKKIFATIIGFVFALTGCAGLGDYEIQISPQLKFESLNPQTFLIKDEDGFVIEPTITKVNWDDSYVIAKQDIQDEDFKKTSEIYFWIIDIKENKVYGNLSKEEYLEKKQELNIDLELMNVDRIRYEKL